jgi:inosine/xanthosine triphosphatase
MKSIVVASTNPVKTRAALSGFRKMFPGEVFQCEGVPASSGVRDQPASDSETFQGALNRARRAAEQRPQADFWVGIEGGVEPCAYPACQDELMAFAWVVVIGRMIEAATLLGREPVNQLIGKGRSGTFFLPESIAGLIRQGMELGQADDAVYGRSNSKQENGAVGILTGDVIDRARLYEHALVLALIPFRSENHA